MTKRAIGFMMLSVMLLCLSGCGVGEVSPQKAKFSPDKVIAMTYDTEETILNGIVIDNESALEDVLSTEYRLVELDAYFGGQTAVELYRYNFNDEYQNDSDIFRYRQFSIPQVNEIFPIEILRHTVLREDETYDVKNYEYYNEFYTIYKVKEGGYYYVFWYHWPEEELYSLSHSIYIASLKSAEEYNNIEVGKCSYADVYTVDRAAEIWKTSYGPIWSSSLLDSGEYYRVDYEFIESENINDPRIFAWRNLIVKNISIVPAESNVGSLMTYVLYEDLPLA